MFPYDDQLLAAVRPTPRSVNDVIGAMQAIDAICADGDGLKWFNRLYLDVTRAVKARVDGGGFQDGEWMAALDVQFAGLYFGALRSELSGRTAPRCWTVLLERRNWTVLARIQCALAGVNAHINHDLPMAIVRTGAAPVHGDAHYDDYTALNTTLSSLVETAKAELHVRLLGDLCQRKVEMSYSLQSRNVRFWPGAERGRDSLGVPVKRRRAMLASNPIEE